MHSDTEADRQSQCAFNTVSLIFTVQQSCALSLLSFSCARQPVLCGRREGGGSRQATQYGMAILQGLREFPTNTALFGYVFSDLLLHFSDGHAFLTTALFRLSQTGVGDEKPNHCYSCNCWSRRQVDRDYSKTLQRQLAAILQRRCDGTVELLQPRQYE